MDITFINDEGKFKYRVCGIIINDSKILAMKEELEIGASIIRPLWLNQSFFTEDVDQLQYHELCIYAENRNRVADISLKRR